MLEHLGGSSRASTVVPLLEHAEHKSMLCSSMLVHNTRGKMWAASKLLQIP